MTSRLAIVVTTINSPSEALRMWLRRFGNLAEIIVIGDRKSPPSFDLSVSFHSLAAQGELEFRLGPLLPESHYARKNLGYLIAFKRGAIQIFDTDDDNAPLESLQLPPDAQLRFDCRMPTGTPANQRWINVYRYFGERDAWPRGFPLEHSMAPAPPLVSSAEPRFAPIQQFLTEGEPDVDAIWRLTRGRRIRFAAERPVYIGHGSYCPFNSQATLWFREAFPLLYLPSTCTSRVADIWRSLVAIRCLHAEGSGVCFRNAGVVHERNPHDPLRDFAEEIPGYLSNAMIVDLLASLSLAKGDLLGNLEVCYEALAAHGFVLTRELDMVAAWASDLRA